jgi:hypothetical protein
MFSGKAALGVANFSSKFSGPVLVLLEDLPLLYIYYIY